MGRKSEIRKRAQHIVVALGVVVGALFWPSTHTEAAAQGPFGGSRSPLVTPDRQPRALASTPDCRPLRAVFYAEDEWLRLAAKLAEHASPCAEYYVSIPPIVGNKTNFRHDQAWRIRANGPNFHALAEVHMPAWRAWVTANNATWYQAGVEARRRMAAAGFDVTLGDDWIVNEFSSAVRRGNGVARTEARDFVHGLHDGDGGPPTKGGVFDIGIDQPGNGPGAADLPTYKSQLEGWLQDSAFWEDMSRYVSDWSQELYGDVRNYAVPGASLAPRGDFLNDYLQHQLLHARLGGAASTAARSFLESAYSPLANAAWQWDYGFGWTMVSAALMEDYVSAQVYALRHFSALDGQSQDHWGFAWHARNTTGLPPEEFAARTGAIMDRLATAIHDSAEPLDPTDPGIGACGPPGENVWCAAELPGALFNDGWKTFTYWGRLALAFTTPAQAITAGSPSGPIVIRTRLGGNAYPTPNALVVALGSSSPQGRFATSPSGPWTPTLAVTIPAGSGVAPSVYYEDTAAGGAALKASALGTDGGAQTETVKPGPVASVMVSPGSASLGAGRSQAFSAAAADAYGNPVAITAAAWSVTPASLGSVSPASGDSTSFTAGRRAGSGSVVATVAGVSGHAAVRVVAAPNRSPRITSARFGEARRGRYVLESIRFRVCDDSSGSLLARVEQALRRGKSIRARERFSRWLHSSGGGCRSYKISWRVKRPFLARGTYTVSLRLRDSEGAWSKPVQHARLRKHARHGGR